MLCSRLTVEFSPPWWVGTLERWEDSRYEVGRVVFGAEPTEPEVLLWVLHQLLPETPWRDTPAGVFFISQQNFYILLLVPPPQNPYDNRGAFIKGGDLHGHL